MECHHDPQCINPGSSLGHCKTQFTNRDSRLWCHRHKRDDSPEAWLASYRKWYRNNVRLLMWAFLNIENSGHIIANYWSFVSRVDQFKEHESFFIRETTNQNYLKAKWGRLGQSWNNSRTLSPSLWVVGNGTGSQANENDKEKGKVEPQTLHYIKQPVSGLGLWLNLQAPFSLFQYLFSNCPDLDSPR